MGKVFRGIGKFFSSTFGTVLQVAAGVVLIASGFGAPIGTALLAASVAVSVVGSFSSAYYQSWLAKHTVIRQNGHLVTTRTTDKSVRLVYGQCRVAGNMIWLHTGGENNKYLYMVLGLSEGEIDSISEIYVNGSREKASQRISDGLLTWGYLTGTANQVPPSELQTDECRQTLAAVAKCDGQKHVYEFTLPNAPVEPNSVTMWVQYEEMDGWASIVDNGEGYLWGPGVVSPDSTINYETGKCKLVFLCNDPTYGSRTPKQDTSILAQWKGAGFVDNCPYLAYAWVRLTYDGDKWSGVPNLTFLIKGIKCYDPRDGSCKWTDNPALHLLDFLTNRRYGLGISLDRIDLQSFIDAANYCDDKGFKFNGLIELNRAVDVVDILCRHFRGNLVYSLGKFKIKFYDWNYEAPVKSFTDSDYVQDSFSVYLPSCANIPNLIEIQYLDPDNKYQVTTCRLYDKVALGRGEERRPLKIELVGADREQATMLGAYYLERARLNHTITFTTHAKAVGLEPGDLIKVSNSDYGIENQIFRIQRVNYQAPDNITVTAVLENSLLYDDEVNLDTYTIDTTNVYNPIDLAYFTYVRGGIVKDIQISTVKYASAYDVHLSFTPCGWDAATYKPNPVGQQIIAYYLVWAFNRVSVDDLDLRDSANWKEFELGEITRLSLVNVNDASPDDRRAAYERLGHCIIKGVCYGVEYVFTVVALTKDGKFIADVTKPDLGLTWKSSRDVDTQFLALPDLQDVNVYKYPVGDNKWGLYFSFSVPQLPSFDFNVLGSYLAIYARILDHQENWVGDLMTYIGVCNITDVFRDPNTQDWILVVDALPSVSDDPNYEMTCPLIKNLYAYVIEWNGFLVLVQPRIDTNQKQIRLDPAVREIKDIRGVIGDQIAIYRLEHLGEVVDAKAYLDKGWIIQAQDPAGHVIPNKFYLLATYQQQPAIFDTLWQDYYFWLGLQLVFYCGYGLWAVSSPTLA